MAPKDDAPDRLQRFCDIQDIQLLKARYAEICDAAIRVKDATLGRRMAELFTEDATVDMPPRGLIKGRQSIAQFYGELLPSTVVWAWHAPGSGIVEVNGDQARGRWIVYALATFNDAPDAPPTVTYGRYDDEFVRTPEGWRQTSLKFVNETRSASNEMQKPVHPLVRPDYVPGVGYLSPDIVQLEKTKLWPQVWLIAAREEQFKERGDFVTFDIADESILIVLGQDQKLRAFYNVCRHRGRRLKDAESGNTGMQITCGFHAWRYALDGASTYVKNPEDWAGVPDFCASTLRLREVKLDTWGGWVWISMNPDIEPLQHYLEPVPRLYEHFEFERTRIGWYKTVVTDCNWKMAMDAFNEAYHSEGTHAQLNRFGVNEQKVPGIPSGRHSALKVTRNNMSEGSLLNQAKVDLRAHLLNLGKELHGTLHALYTDYFVRAAERLTREVGEDTPAAEVMATFKRFHREEMEKAGARWPDQLTDAEVAAAGGTYIIFPNTICLAAYDGILWYRARPNGDDPDSCLFDIWWLGRYAPGQEPAYRHEIYATPAEFAGQNPFLDQDFANMGKVQMGMKSRGFSGGRTNPLQERAVSHLHEVVFDHLFNQARKWKSGVS